MTLNSVVICSINSSSAIIPQTDREMFSSYILCSSKKCVSFVCNSFSLCVTNITEPQTGQRTEKSLFHSKQVALGGIDIKKRPNLVSERPQSQLKYTGADDIGLIKYIY